MNDMIQFLFDKRITTHIDTKDEKFYNGLIIEVHETFLVIRDRFLGATPIAISEIKTIERFRGMKERNFPFGRNSRPDMYCKDCGVVISHRDLRKRIEEEAKKKRRRW